MPSKQEDGYLSCSLSAGEAEAFFKACRELPTALYVTSPDYLGNTLDISALAEMCHRYGVLLLVDNAHGAYLKFLSPSRHPIDLGADACADSAHKTLPALTGAAYLHISKNAPPAFAASAKDSMALFASTSPSYLILQSLDALNAHLAQGYARRLASFVLLANQQKQLLCEHGFVFLGNEPLKWTIDAKRIGYTGKELADLLSARGLVCEFSDPDYLVLMLSPEAGASVLDRVYRVLLEIEQRPAITTRPPAPVNRPTVLSPRVALLSPMELIPTEEASGRILASPTVSCPPAVPIVRIGERIDSAAIEAFHYYSIKICLVVKE